MCALGFQHAAKNQKRMIPVVIVALQVQIGADRCYAAHLLLKDPRGVPILVPLLKDREVNYIVPWSSGRSAINPRLNF
jgi:hypothetical protein